MKKIFIAFAAVAAMVGCSKENNSQGVETKSESIAINASIDIDATRVTVEGEKYTDVKWEQGDMVALASEAGMSTTLSATEAGDKVRFVGEGVYAADEDTYYAIYPATTIDGGVATIDLANQSGDDAAVLVAKAEGVAKGSIDMSFKPANALLHVAVSGASELVKAEFKAFDGSAIASTFTYNFAEESASASGEVAAYTIESPAASFFFSLPADLDMANGYIVSLTDAAGNVCSKAYNGKTFAKGTTTRVDIAWSTPSVTLGAKTSYSYYLAGQSASANSCANNVIYFTGDCASSYAGIQNAFISEVGFVVDGTTYSSANGQVTWNKSSKTFSMSNMTVSEWRGYSAEAYIKTTDGKTLTSSDTLYITGLPYTLNIAANDGTWTEEGYVAWNTSSAVRLGYNQWGGEAYIQKSDFKLPANVNVVVNSTGIVNGTGALIKVENTVSILVSGSSIFSKTQKGKSEASYGCTNKTCTMSVSNPSIKVNSSYNLESAKVLIKSLALTYGN